MASTAVNSIASLQSLGWQRQAFGTKREQTKDFTIKLNTSSSDTRFAKIKIATKKAGGSLRMSAHFDD